jgi:FkbM family methyltransferase
MNWKERINAALDVAIHTNFQCFQHELLIRARVAKAKNVCLFGAGRFISWVLQDTFLRERVTVLCDNDPEKWGQAIKGFSCVSPNELKHMDELVVLVTLARHEGVCAQLQALGIEHYPVGEMFINMYDSYVDGEWFRANTDRIHHALDLMHDEASREILVNAFCHHVAPHLANRNYCDMETKGQFFDAGLFRMGNEECFVDAGGYQGDTILRFLEATSNQFRSIHSFEPSPTHFAKLATTIASLPAETRHKIRAYSMGLFDGTENVFLSGEEMAVHITKQEGTIRVKTCTMDQELANQAVTFIKMNIEGAEIEAIKGARGIIAAQKPKLAICVYHKLHHLWDVPLLIHELNPDYKLALRHHTPLVWETDCYAW